MTKHRIYAISFASVYPHYVAKAEKKGRTKADVDEIIRWLTGYTQQGLDAELEKQTSFESFFGQRCGRRKQTAVGPVDRRGKRQKLHVAQMGTSSLGIGSAVHAVTNARFASEVEWTVKIDQMSAIGTWPLVRLRAEK